MLPRLTELTLSNEPVRRLRAEVVRGLTGEVLEIGFGSGLNLPHYPAEVTKVAAVEPSDTAWRLAAARRRGLGRPVERVGLDGQSLAAPDASYDAALCTFSLCTIPDPEAALREVVRVLRPGGTFHLLEHGLAPDQGVARWQHRLDPVQRRVAGGCHLSRDVAALLAGSGLEEVQLDAAYLPGPSFTRPWSYVYRGLAHRAPDAA